jgi:hypothetical protein
MEQQKQIKKGHPGHFAECNTRQRVALPSAMTLALGKEGNLGTGKAIFAECCCQGTRQRDWQRGPLEDSLPSASPPDTRQRSLFAECQRRHSAKDPSPSLGAVTVTFLCRVSNGTRQNLCRVPDKKYSAKRLLPMYSSPSVLCRVLHSAKSLPSVCDTRQRS